MQVRFAGGPVTGALHLHGAEDRLQLALLRPLAGTRRAVRVNHLVGHLGLRLSLDTVLVELTQQLLALLGQQSLQVTVVHPLRLLTACHAQDVLERLPRGGERVSGLGRASERSAHAHRASTSRR